MDQFIEYSKQHCNTFSDILAAANEYRLTHSVSSTDIPEELRISYNIVNTYLTNLTAPTIHFNYFWDREHYTDKNFIQVPATLDKPIYWFSQEDQCLYIGQYSIIEPSHLDECDIRMSEYGGRYVRHSVCQPSLVWRTVKRPTKEGYYLQSIQEMISWINNPYFAKWCVQLLSNPNIKEVHELAFLFTHPELELLDKMTINGIKGFTPLNNLIGAEVNDRNLYGYRYWRGSSMMREAYNRNFKEGTNIKEIINLPFNLIKQLWVCSDLVIWDNIRKMLNLRGCTADEAIRILDLNLNASDLSQVDEILRATYDNKPVFSYTTLFNYLNRLDVYEAISLEEGLPLIRDCLTMSRQINEKPTFMEKDSIKREHDLLVRRQRQVQNAKLAEQIASRYTDKYKFTYGQYIIREIKDYDDLADEAKQQSNCLEYAYANRIADGSSLIYVMRYRNNPTKSLISIELDPAGTICRQCFLAHNARVTETSQLNCLQAWDKHRDAINQLEETQCESNQLISTLTE